MTKPMSQLGMMTFYHVLGQRSENYRYNKIKVLHDKSATVLVVGAGFYWRRAAWCFRTMLVCPKLGPFLKSLRPTLLITIEDMLIEELFTMVGT